MSHHDKGYAIKKSVIERYFGELFNEGKVELVSSLLHPNYVNRSPGSPDLPTGRDGVPIVVKALRAAFPDLHYTIEGLVIGEDAVAVRCRMRGTHEGALFGTPPTHRAIDVMQMTIERFEGDQIIEHHRLTDEMAMMRQLGLAGS